MSVQEPKRRSLCDAVLSVRRPVVIELPTPRGVECDPVMEFARMGQDTVDSYLIPDVPTGRIRADPLAISSMVLANTDADVIASLSVRHRSQEASVAMMLGLWIAGVRNLHIVMGDPLVGRRQVTYRHGGAVSAIRTAKELANGWVTTPRGRSKISGHPKFFVGSALLPNRKGEEELAKKKLDAGVDFFITQVSFDGASLPSFVDRLRAAGSRLDKPVFVALAVIEHRQSLEALRRLDGVFLPDRLRRELSSSSDIEGDSIEAAIRVFEETESCLGGTVKLGAYVLPLGLSCRSIELARRIRG